LQDAAARRVRQRAEGPVKRRILRHLANYTQGTSCVASSRVGSGCCRSGPENSSSATYLPAPVEDRRFGELVRTQYAAAFNRTVSLGAVPYSELVSRSHRHRTRLIAALGPPSVSLRATANKLSRRDSSSPSEQSTAMYAAS
jgi:hypothetical protein